MLHRRGSARPPERTTGHHGPTGTTRHAPWILSPEDPHPCGRRGASGGTADAHHGHYTHHKASQTPPVTHSARAASVCPQPGLRERGPPSPPRVRIVSHKRRQPP